MQVYGSVNSGRSRIVWGLSHSPFPFLTHFFSHQFLFSFPPSSPFLFFFFPPAFLLLIHYPSHLPAAKRFPIVQLKRVGGREIAVNYSSGVCEAFNGITVFPNLRKRILWQLYKVIFVALKRYNNVLLLTS